ncbi:MAG: squalene/phytoene synthase family protein [Verrucomicrobia bacterium]|nr:squalene/phytoene synthase family protein [Verrucomicrobiota bacterium]
MLRDVSRSFYLTLRVLPGSIRPQIGLAYLLARASDTIADTEIVAVAQRLEALRSLRGRILGEASGRLDFSELARRQGSLGERRLLERIEEILVALARFPPVDQQHMRTVLSIITSGQALDLERFAGAGPAQILALKTDTELEDYTYRVAGCVGEFWTRMCRAHVFPSAVVDEELLLANGVKFGQGLQLVNVLRDLPRDLRQGRCYLPGDRLAAAGLTPAALLEAANEAKLRPLYDGYLTRAEENLAAGWAYTNALPSRCVRLRLACTWPILIGVRTLTLLRTAPVLDPQQRVKVPRTQVRKLILASLVCYPFPVPWQGLFARAKI